MASDAANLDPVNAKDNADIWLITVLGEGLVQCSSDGKNIEPCLAEKWDISKDNLTYTFHLRSGVKFSNGADMTADDCVYSIKRARDTQSSQWAFSLTDVKDVTAKDASTVVITLKEPSAAFLSDLAMFNADIMPKAYCESAGDTGLSQKPVSTGPYMLDEWKKGESVTFKKNPYYWQKGKPKTDKIKFMVVPDDNSRLMQLQSGAIDVDSSIPCNLMQTAASNSKLVAKTYPSTMVYYVTLNTTKDSLKDVKVRQALEYATNKEALAKTVTYGYGKKSVSFLCESDPYFDSTLKDAHNYNVDKAKQLLQEAGKSNLTLNMQISSGSTLYQQIATVLKEQWAQAGVTLNITQLDRTAVKSAYKGMTYEVELSGWNNDITDTSEWVDYSCVYANDKCSFTGWQNSDVEKWATQAKQELDTSKRKELYSNIQKAFQNDDPLIPIFSVPNTVAMNKKISGFVQDPLGYYHFQDLAKSD
jgi:peptide/nickel transport system substrate-binding protein